MDLSTVRNRDRLKPQREPYWHKIDARQYLGFRPSMVGGPGSWIARWYDQETRRNRYNALGEFGDLTPSDRYGAALKAAREWLEHVGAGGSTKVITVKEACEKYAKDKPDAAARFARYVYKDPIAKVPLQKLTDRQVRAWRERLTARPALVTRRKEGRKVTRKRSPVTLNRDMVPFRAALNDALERGDVLTSRAWKAALRPVDVKGARRNLYLDRGQRKELIKALPDDAAALVRGLCSLPLRPGALAALRVGDFDARRKEIVIDRDKAGGGRAILLPDSAVALFKEQARNKLPAAPLFARADGKAWDKDAWKGPIKEAVQAGGLPAGATAYTLRHSTITDLVTSGLDLMTVAQVSGTSVRMIEKHYAHLQRERARDALAALAL